VQTVDHWWRSGCGQATLEYVAVLGVVAVLLIIAGSVTAGPAIANGVGRGFQRALCLVAHASCATVTPRPCTIRTTNTGAEVSAKLAFVRVGRQAGLLRNERSDGSVSLTLLQHVDAGLTAGVGAEGHLRLGSIEVGDGAVAQLEAVARLGGGRVWNVRDAVAADALQRRLVELLAGGVASGLPMIGTALKLAQHALDVGEGRDLPAPAAHIMDARAGLTASLKLPGGNELSAALGVGVGATRETASGRLSALLRLEGDAGAVLAGGLGGLSGGGAASLQLTYDRAGRPLELTVSATGHAGGSLAGRGVLPDAVSARLTRGANISASVVLDLARAESARAVARLVHALSPAHAEDLLAAARSLAALLQSEGRLDVQRYGSHESGIGAGGEVGLGAQAGIEAGITRAASELLDAWTRPPGGAWERRIDCLGS
jgi:hypothetical protein